MRNRLFVIVAALSLALGLVGVTLVLALDTNPAPAGQTESEREAAAAAAEEAGPALSFRKGTAFTPTEVISGPLFIGISDTFVPTYLIDPDTHMHYELFDGVPVWGSAYDHENKRVFIASGTTLIEWPINGTPTVLGTMKGGVSGANHSLVALAYHDGVLYGARNIGTATEPEGLYTIDLDTLLTTLYTSYPAGPTNVDIGGLAADPETGDLYGTNDGVLSRGLVRIAANGVLTLIAPYPQGEDDIDGLAIGDGRAYLVTDEPGDIYVYDFAAADYTTPIANPWVGSYTFAGATWIIPPVPGISLAKTVGIDPDACAATAELEVNAGTEVTYCYTVTNTGEVELTLHDLEDTELGGLLSGYTHTLPIGAGFSFTATAQITQTTVNTATWTAYNPGPTHVVTATAAATVTVPPPSISLSKTVGVDAGECADTTEIEVYAGTDVTYCYTVANTGGHALTLHDLSDSELGDILDEFPHALAPEASFSITRTVQIEETTVNSATWTAYNPGPTDLVTATAEATVTILVPQPDITVTPAALTAHLAGNQQKTVSLTIGNVGLAELSWSLGYAPADCDEPGVLWWVSATPFWGVTAPGAATELEVAFNGAELSHGVTTGVLCINSNDPDEPSFAVPLTAVKGAVLLPLIAGSP